MTGGYGKKGLFLSFSVKLKRYEKATNNPHSLVGKQGLSSSDPGAIRTHDQRLKRPLLYQLSYGILSFKIKGRKITRIHLQMHTKSRLQRGQGREQQ